MKTTSARQSCMTWQHMRTARLHNTDKANI
jgi:hypothetical protein